MTAEIASEIRRLRASAKSYRDGAAFADTTAQRAADLNEAVRLEKKAAELEGEHK